MRERTQFKAIKSSNKEKSEPHHKLAGASKAVRSLISRSEVNVNHLRTTKTLVARIFCSKLIQKLRSPDIFEVFIASNN
jgi:hypothetical protein